MVIHRFLEVPYTLDGWSAPESAGTWTIDKKANLCLQFIENGTSSIQLIFQVRALFASIDKPLVLTLSIGNTRVIEWHLKNENTHSLEAIINSDLIETNKHLIFCFECNETYIPEKLTRNSDSRSLGIFVEKIIFLEKNHSENGISSSSRLKQPTTNTTSKQDSYTISSNLKEIKDNMTVLLTKSKQSFTDNQQQIHREPLKTYIIVKFDNE